MTTKLPPGVKLEWNGEGESEGGDTLSDSAWEDLPEETEPDEVQRRLGKIARARRESK